jgi:hypothetical protein
MLFAALMASVTALAAPTIPAQNCPNATRGSVLIVPQISNGRLQGSLRVTRLINTLAEIPAANVSDLNVTNDGLFSFKAKDSKGQDAKVATARDSVGRLVVEVWLKDQGMIGYTCPKSQQR